MEEGGREGKLRREYVAEKYCLREGADEVPCPSG